MKALDELWGMKVKTVERLWSVGLLNKRTHNKLRLLVWAETQTAAEDKLRGVLFGDCCEYELRNTVTEPYIEGDGPVIREV